MGNLPAILENFSVQQLRCQPLACVVQALLGSCSFTRPGAYCGRVCACGQGIEGCYLPPIVGCTTLPLSAPPPCQRAGPNSLVTHHCGCAQSYIVSPAAVTQPSALSTRPLPPPPPRATALCPCHSPPSPPCTVDSPLGLHTVQPAHCLHQYQLGSRSQTLGSRQNPRQQLAQQVAASEMQPSSVKLRFAAASTEQGMQTSSNQLTC
jgi:hypothetical protein